MELADLRREYRRRADDNVVPPHTSDEDVARLATEAEREAAVRALLLYDDGPDFDIAVVAGTASYNYDPLIHRIEGVSVQLAAGGRPYDLDRVGLDWIHDQCDWQGRTGRPEVVADDGRGRLHLWPTPSQAATLSLRVYRYPRLALEEDDDEPEIRAEHHEGLVDWMLYRTWSTKDGEQEDSARAALVLAEFERRFGPRETADVMRRHRERRRVTARPVR